MKKILLFLVLFVGLNMSAQVQFGNVQKLATVTASGNITTQNLVPAGVATANSAVEITLTGANLLSIQTTGTYTGALSVQITINGTTWVTLGGTQIININSPNTGLASITSALQSIFQLEVGGALKARVTGLAAMTGTATVTMIGLQNTSIVGLDSAIPPGTNAIGAVTQSGTWTVTQGTAAAAAWLANPLNPAVATTGDVGAKSATFNGATQTNTTAKGVVVIFNVGTVSGTSPTMVCKLQGSADSGTTWFDLPSATTAILTATGVFGIEIYPNITTVAATTTTGTTAQISSVLPRTWRVVYTIGGTSPIFMLTNVQVNYLL
ncbi:hypothetical protein [Flavobacterium sp. IMCC34518]|uniref:hypothetical protein n=1 Tax=Flavobacterium sp. IMCC34518 TaxID=3003623 RepID=UPI0022AC3CD9|nr:hypothetical protein [Flavobacterium sp. IMCC34518]